MLALSERLTLLVYDHWSHYPTLTHCSTAYIVSHLRPSVPRPGRSTRFGHGCSARSSPCVVLSTRLKAAARGLPVSARRLLLRVTITA
jgi:hypothetical protein